MKTHVTVMTPEPVKMLMLGTVMVARTLLDGVTATADEQEERPYQRGRWKMLLLKDCPSLFVPRSTKSVGGAPRERRHSRSEKSRFQNVIVRGTIHGFTSQSTLV